MKILIAFYSLSGITKRVCTRLDELLREKGCDVAVEELIDRKNRNGAIGCFSAAKDAVFSKETEIDDPLNNPSDFDMLVVATPVWTFNMPPAIRTYLKMHASKLPEKIAGICTQGGCGDQRTYKLIEELTGKKFTATKTFIDKDVKKEDADKFEKPLGEFADTLAS